MMIIASFVTALRYSAASQRSHGTEVRRPHFHLDTRIGVTMNTCGRWNSNPLLPKVKNGFGQLSELKPIAGTWCIAGGLLFSYVHFGMVCTWRLGVVIARRDHHLSSRSSSNLYRTTLACPNPSRARFSSLD